MRCLPWRFGQVAPWQRPHDAAIFLTAGPACGGSRHRRRRWTHSPGLVAPARSGWRQPTPRRSTGIAYGVQSSSQPSCVPGRISGPAPAPILGSGDSPSVPRRWKRAGELERARDGQPQRLGEELPGRQIERPGLLYQLARNGDRHPGMASTLELYPRTSTALVGVVKLGLVPVRRR